MDKELLKEIETRLTKLETEYIITIKNINSNIENINTQISELNKAFFNLLNEQTKMKINIEWISRLKLPIYILTGGLTIIGIIYSFFKLKY